MSPGLPKWTRFVTVNVEIPDVEVGPVNVGRYLATLVDVEDGSRTALITDGKGRIITRPIGQYLETPPTLDDGDLAYLLLNQTGEIRTTDPTTQDKVDAVRAEIDNETYGLSALHDDVEVVDGLHDVPDPNDPTNAQMRDVIGNKTDAATLLISDTLSIMAHAKGAVHLQLVPSKDATADSYARDVIGKKDDTAVETVGTTKSIMAYAKGLIELLTDTTYGLAALETLVDDLETRLTEIRAGYLDELDFDLDARLGTPAGASLAADLLTIDNLVDEVESLLENATYGLAALGAYVDDIPDIEGSLEVPPLDAALALLMDEGTGTTAYDASLNGNDGAIDGATWMDTVKGRALYLDGTNDKVTVPEDASLDFSGSFTVAALIKKVSNPAASYSSIVQKGYPPTGGAAFGLLVDVAGAARFFVRKSTNDGYNYSPLQAIGTAWALVVGIFRDQENIEIMVNDVSGGTTAVDWSPLTNDLDLTIGYMQQYFNAYFKRLWLWDRELSSAELTTLYKSSRREIESLTHSKYGLPAIEDKIETDVAKFSELNVKKLLFFKRHETLGTDSGDGAFTITHDMEVEDRPAYSKVKTADVDDNYASSHGHHYITRIARGAEYTPTTRIVEIRARLAQTATCAMSIGLGGSDEIETDNDCVEFFYDTDVGANFQARSWGTAEEQTDTGIAGDTDWHVFRIVETSSSVKFYIDGVLVATHTTQIPESGLLGDIREARVTVITRAAVESEADYEYVAVWSE